MRSTPRTDAVIARLAFAPTQWIERVQRVLGITLNPYRQWRVGFHGCMHALLVMTKHAIKLEQELNDAHEMLSSYHRVNEKRGCGDGQCNIASRRD